MWLTTDKNYVFIRTHNIKSWSVNSHSNRAATYMPTEWQSDMGGRETVRSCLSPYTRGCGPRYPSYRAWWWREIRFYRESKFPRPHHHVNNWSGAVFKHKIAFLLCVVVSLCFSKSICSALRHTEILGYTYILCFSEETLLKSPFPWSEPPFLNEVP